LRAGFAAQHLGPLVQVTWCGAADLPILANSVDATRRDGQHRLERTNVSEQRPATENDGRAAAQCNQHGGTHIHEQRSVMGCVFTRIDCSQIGARAPNGSSLRRSPSLHLYHL
jgi:hypothetical protein